MKDDLVNDTISRQAALDALDKVAEMFPYRIPGKAKTYRQYNEAWSDAIDAAENALEALPSAQRWIPCSERMPFVDEYGKSDQVLATCGLQGAETSSIRWLRILYFNGCNWCFPTGESYEQMVYAWMPLPKPAKIEV